MKCRETFSEVLVSYMNSCMNYYHPPPPPPPYSLESACEGNEMTSREQ